MFQLRIFLSWNDVGSSWWGCEPRDYARSGRWPPLTPSLGSQPHHSAPTSIHSGKIPSWNKIFRDLGYPLSKSLAGKFEVFPSWSIFILSCLKEQENIILFSAWPPTVPRGAFRLRVKEVVFFEAEWPEFEPRTLSMRRGRSIHSATPHLAKSTFMTITNCRAGYSTRIFGRRKGLKLCLNPLRSVQW